MKNTEGSVLYVRKVDHRYFLFKSNSQVRLLCCRTIFLLLSVFFFTLAPNLVGCNHNGVYFRTWVVLVCGY
jgi:hypothetical protein